MTTLHIINSAKTPSELIRLFQYFCAGDSVIFIQDGCYSLTTPLTTEGLSFYALSQDMSARGIEASTVAPLGYEDFVDLTLANNKTVSW